jgi:putative phage-type endonuclease
MTPPTLSPVRVDRITASRVPKILGLSPFGGPDSVIREMIREHFQAPVEVTPQFEHGWANEALALAEYESATGYLTEIHGNATATVIHPEHPWLAATPDAWIGATGLVQIKCPERARLALVEERPDIAAQMQCEMACTGRVWDDLCMWRYPAKPVISTLSVDIDWLPSVHAELKTFHELYLRTLADDALVIRHLSPLVDERTDLEWQNAVVNYCETLIDKQLADRANTEARDALIALTGTSKTTKGAGVTVSRRAGGKGESWAIRVD